MEEQRVIFSQATRDRFAFVVAVCALLVQWSSATIAAEQHTDNPVAATRSDEATQNQRLLQLGPGDTVSIQVYGQPDMSTTVSVADDGTVTVPIIGDVPVRGLSPFEAATRIENALVDGKILIKPQVTVTLTVSKSQRVSVLGEVGNPGRYPVESNTTILDLLALAGGTKDTGAGTVFLLHPAPDGTITRTEIHLADLFANKNSTPAQTLQGGDSIYVPKAAQFYIFGEVNAPSMYRIESGMTILQAIARAGGVTLRGSRNRFEVRRKDANGIEHEVKAKLTDLVQPDDIIRVKESIF
jgi:polysaccharide export outer membrane protein